MGRRRLSGSRRKLVLTVYLVAAQVAMLLAAATLGVFKPGGRTRWPAHGD
jgi:hypothetical protein